MSKVSPHWGSWIERRAHFLGFRRQQDFAEAVGCGRTQLAKWLALPSPPDLFRKSFDISLASALQVDRRTLFTSWKEIEPEAAPVVAASGGEVPWEAEYPKDDGMRELIDETLWQLRGPALAEVLNFAVILASEFRRDLHRSPEKIQHPPSEMYAAAADRVGEHYPQLRKGKPRQRFLASMGGR